MWTDTNGEVLKQTIPKFRYLRPPIERPMLLYGLNSLTELMLELMCRCAAAGPLAHLHISRCRVVTRYYIVANTITYHARPQRPAAFVVHLILWR